MSNSLVSVIIPTYNNKNVVCDAIDCAFNQTHENREIIVIDDGSADGTGHMLAEKYGNRIKYVYQENRGPSGSRNTGIRYASGKYLQFLDADDLIAKNKISIQVEALHIISGEALVYCDYICCDINDISITYEGRLSPVLQREKPFDDLMMRWETELSIPIHCFLFDAAIFREHGISFDESLPNHVDWECWMSVFALNPGIIYIDRPLAYYRMRSDSLCRNRPMMRQGYLMAIDKQIQKHKNNREVMEKMNIRKRQIQYLYRDVSPLVRKMESCHPLIRKVYQKIVPWRMQRIFD